VGGLLAIHEQTGNGSAKAGQVIYPLYDGNGNIVRLLNSGGGVVASYAYDGFGNRLNPAASDIDSSGYADEQMFGFSTKFRNAETGLYYYGYRYYDPATGRWPSRDPIGEDGGVNLYGFVVNDGVNLVDILGLDYWVEEASGNEPKGHLSICVGKPEAGKYRCFSFGVDLTDCCDKDTLAYASLKGKVYEEDSGDQGGEIRTGTYFITGGAKFDQAVIDAILAIEGKSGNYNPLNTCREWTLSALAQINKQLGDRALQKDPPFKNVPAPAANPRPAVRKIGDGVSTTSNPTTESPNVRIGVSTITGVGGAISSVKGGGVGVSGGSTTTSGGGSTTATSTRQVTTSTDGNGHSE
jgi:RHS repeat-associated protein